MIKPIDDELYQIITRWGKEGHKYFVMPKEIYPETGYVSYFKEKPVFAGWMYMTQCKSMAFIAYVIANPESDYVEREHAFGELINKFNDVARDNGIKCLFTSANIGSLVKRFQDLDFITCDPDVVHLMRSIK